LNVQRGGDGLVVEWLDVWFVEMISPMHSFL